MGQAPTRIPFYEILCFFVLFFSLYMFTKKNWIGEWVGGVWIIQVFLGFLEFFQLDKTPYSGYNVNAIIYQFFAIDSMGNQIKTF